MSKISLEGNVSGSGTLTIAAPNTNSNFTLTLPTETGTIITNSGNQAGSFTTLNTSGAVVFNDAGADVDFRVEGDTDANLLFVDASADAVGIGTNAPSFSLDIRRTDNAALRLSRSGTAGQISSLVFEDGTSTLGTGNTIRLSSSSGAFLVDTGGTSGDTAGGSEAMRIDSSGNLLVGITTTAGTGGAYISSIGNIVCSSNNANSTSSKINWTSPGFTSGSQTKYGVRLENGTLDDFEFGYFTDVGGSVGAIIDTSGTDLGTIIRSDTNGVRLSNNGTSWSSYSDERLKNVTGEIDSALDKVNAMRGVYFSWKSDEENTQRCGLIAQEVEQVLPEVVDNDTDFKQVRYTEVTPLLVQAIKELKAELDTVKAELATLKGQA